MIADIIIGAIAIFSVAISVFYLFIKKNKNGNSCKGDCNHCGYCKNIKNHKNSN